MVIANIFLVGHIIEDCAACYEFCVKWYSGNVAYRSANELTLDFRCIKNMLFLAITVVIG